MNKGNLNGNDSTIAGGRAALGNCKSGVYSGVDNIFKYCKKAHESVSEDLRMVL